MVFVLKVMFIILYDVCEIIDLEISIVSLNLFFGINDRGYL